VARRRRLWKARQDKVAVARLVFVDETWAKTNMTRTHGRCAKGQRLVAKVPHGRRSTLTFVAGLRCDGIAAPCLLDGPIDAESFLAWVAQLLVPTLRPGDIVVMDTSAVTRTRRSGAPSVRPVPSCSICRNTALT
jgi:hypothetical protein